MPRTAISDDGGRHSLLVVEPFADGFFVTSDMTRIVGSAQQWRELAEWVDKHNG